MSRSSRACPGSSSSCGRSRASDSCAAARSRARPGWRSIWRSRSPAGRRRWEDTKSARPAPCCSSLPRMHRPWCAPGWRESRGGRLTSIDENPSLEVSSVLAYLRALQISQSLAILVVHHARKSNGNGSAAGLALRGSGDFWAWGDSNVYLSRRQDRLHLAVEHRSAPTSEPRVSRAVLRSAGRSVPAAQRRDEVRARASTA